MLKLGVISGIIIAILCGAVYLQQKRVETFAAEVALLREANSAWAARVKELRESQEKLRQLNGELLQKNDQLRANFTYYVRLFNEHDLQKLAEEKPGLITRRMRDGTARVWHDFEEASNKIRNILQPHLVSSPPSDEGG